MCISFIGLGYIGGYHGSIVVTVCLEHRQRGMSDVTVAVHRNKKFTSGCLDPSNRA